MADNRLPELGPEASDLLNRCLDALHEKDRISFAGGFVHGFVHNVNGPLQNMSMLAEVLQSGLDRLDRLHKAAGPGEGEPQWEELLAKQRTRLDQMVQQIAALADGLRDFMHVVEIGHSAKGVDLNALLQRMMSVFKADLFFKHKVTSTLDLAPNLPVARCPGCDLAPALFHVIHNAVISMRDTPRKELGIATSLEGGTLCIEVRDTGCGFENCPEAETLFDLFYSGWPERKPDPLARDPLHLGYGLWTARRLLARSGAAIRLEKRAEGSVAVIEIPVGER